MNSNQPHTSIAFDVEGRAETMLEQYGQVFDSIILRLGLTQDVAVHPVRSSPVYQACCDGTLDISPDVLYNSFSLPFVFLKRFYPVSQQLHGIIKSLTANMEGFDVAAVGLYKHKVIQMMRCYAVVAKFCPKFYLNSLLEWLIAQTVELAALFNMTLTTLAPENASGPTIRSWPKLLAACKWVQGNVAFVLCFVRGAHFVQLLGSDYETGLKSVSDFLKAESMQQGSGQVPSLTGEQLCEMMEGLKTQLTRLEQQEEMYAKASKAAPDAGSSGWYKSTVDMLLDPSWNTVTALCISPKRVPELETVVAPLFRVFQQANREMDLVHWAIDKDISDGVKEANSLFRTPSTATRLLRNVFFCDEGSEFLRNLLQPSLKKLWKQKLPVELDPIRLPFDIDAQQKDELLKNSAKVVMGVADSILQATFKAVETVPVQIRKFLLYARNTFLSAQNSALGKMSEESSTKLVVASLFFLRFICPAIVTPHAFGVIDSEPPFEVQRSLILVGKVVQNTASGVEFDGSKEEYMSVCNSFTRNNQSSMLKLFNSLIDAQSIGMRELKTKRDIGNKKKAGSKKELAHMLQDELENKVFHLRDVALIVNEISIKRSFLPVFRSGGADDDSVRTIRSLVKLDVKLQEQRMSTRAEHVLAAMLKVSSPYSQALQATVADFGEYLPNDLIVFAPEDAAGPSNFDQADTSNVPLDHPLLMLDTITAHRPSRLAAIARMLRVSGQEVWEAGIALRDLSRGPAMGKSFQEISDQETPAIVVTGAHDDSIEGSEDEDPSSGGTSDSALGGALATLSPKSPTSADTGSVGKSQGTKLLTKLRLRRDSTSEPESPLSASPGPTLSGSVSGASDSKNSLAGLMGPPSRQKSMTAVNSPFQSPFGSPMRKRKAFKKRGVGGIGNDERYLWAPALVFPQVLGLLHFLTVLRHTLKHARLENRQLMETPDADAVLANCVFEYSKITKQAGNTLLSLAISDPSNPEIGNLGLALANAGVLLTRAALGLMNVDRQVLRHVERKGKHKTDKSDNPDNDSSGGGGSGSGVQVISSSPSVSTPSQKRKQKKNRLQKTPKHGNLLATANDSVEDL